MQQLPAHVAHVLRASIGRRCAYFADNLLLTSLMMSRMFRRLFRGEGRAEGCVNCRIELSH
jgi:hypothetical protein